MRHETTQPVADECDSFSDRVWNYEYDHENRLTVATSGAVRVDYRYDVFGHQTKRRTSGASVTTNRMYYAGEPSPGYGVTSWQMVAEYNGGGALERKYVYGPGIDEPVRMRVTGGAGTNYYFHADGLGSVTEITTNGGFKVESYTYDVYGTPTIYNAAGSVISTPSTGNRLLFTGRDRDPDTTLYNYRYRYYSPSLGRFVQVDPIRINSYDLNLYRYIWNSPTGLTDPYGNCPAAAVAIGFTPPPLWPIALIGIGAIAVGTWVWYIATIPSTSPPPSSGIGGGGVVSVNVPPTSVTSPTIPGTGIPPFTLINPVTGSPVFAHPGAGSSLPVVGAPGSSAAADDGRGGGTIRDYGADGRAETDYDFGHDHGAGDPHAHDWNWNNPNPRGPGRPLNPGE